MTRALRTRVESKAADEEFLAAIEGAPWKSTNYGGTPHQYILFEWAPEVFTELANRIAAHGRKSLFRGRPYTVLVLGDSYYWRMVKARWSLGQSPEKTLINRRVYHEGEIVWANEITWDTEKEG